MLRQGELQQADFDLLEGHWDTPARLEAVWASNGLSMLTLDTLAVELSAGQRMKVALCAAFASNAGFLLLDEPTNHLDLWALTSLEQALRAYPGAIMIVSHDTIFLKALQLTHTLLCHDGEWELRDVIGA